jgi:hypothetical protein
VQRAAYRTFDADCEFLRDPRHRANIGEYLTDMLDPYGLPLDEKLLESGAGQSYGEMAAALVAELIEPDELIDLLVVAFGIPDVWPGRATATYLSEICPGNPLSFAICDQGVASAYTALRLVGEYVRTGACGRALLLALEQPTLPYEVPAGVPVPGRAAAVGLVCAAQPAAIAIGSVDVYAGVTPEGAEERLAQFEQPLRAPAGQPYTGGLGSLATAAAHARGGRVTIADYDPFLRYFCAVTAELSG